MLIGVVGRDPELRHTPAGVPVASFSVATVRHWVSPEGEPRSATDWFPVVAWQHLAEACRAQLSAGSALYLEGRLETRSWQEPGQPPQHRTEIVATEVIPLDESREPSAQAPLPEEQPSGAEAGSAW
jgi:single-strand DNA-binding protein